MTDLPPAARLHRHDSRTALPVAHDLVVLTYDERFLRRRRLVTVHDEGFLVSLAEVTSLQQGDAFELADGRLIEVIAAEEPLIEISGDRLAEFAWHIGNRHTPCQIEPDRLLVRADHVIEAMLLQLGARVRRASEPFAPVGGAYGHGRTMGHDHGHDHHHGDGDHDHGDHDHGDHHHGHDHAEDHHHDHAAPRRAPPVILARAPARSEPVPHDLPAEGPFGDGRE